MRIVIRNVFSQLPGAYQILDLDTNKTLYNQGQWKDKKSIWTDADSFWCACWVVKEDAEDFFKEWLKTLPKAKQDEVFASYIAEKLVGNR